MKIERNTSCNSNKRSGRRTGTAKNARNERGSSIVELGAIAFIMPVIMLICVNVGVMVFAAYINDSACRDAARAAAQRSNPSDAYQVANIVVKNHSATCGGLISSLVLLGQDPGPVGTATGSSFEYNSFADPTTGESNIDEGPYVKVTTQLLASLPAPIVFDGASFTNQVKFKQSYIFPIVHKGTGQDSSDDDDNVDENLALDDPDDKAVKEAALLEENLAQLGDYDDDPS
ncbi:MAG: hypothetical protein K2X77_01265 [Candidatus Obscuribacterales bacterium]|nr:hypothetical protein [Candidatus Obscuribacterales bacterium]